MGEEQKEHHRVKIVNIGLQSFFDAVARQNVEVIQLDWRPPTKIDKQMQDLLDSFL